MGFDDLKADLAPRAPAASEAQGGPPLPSPDAASRPAPPIKTETPAAAEGPALGRPNVPGRPAIPVAAAPVAAAAPPRSDAATVVRAELRQDGDGLKLVFPFAKPTAAAVFRRADTLWAVFDSAIPIDVGALQKDSTRTISAGATTSHPDFQIVRLKLERPRLTSISAADNEWTIAIGDTAPEPTLPFALARNVAAGMRSTAVAPFERPQSLHRIADPDVGDTLFVITGLRARARRAQGAGLSRIPCPGFEPGHRGPTAGRRCRG